MEQSVPVARPTASGATASPDIAARLTEAGLLDQADLDRARRAQDQLGEPMRVILDRLGVIAQDVWARMAAETCALPLIAKADLDARGRAASDITAEFLREHAAVLLDRDGVALADPADGFTLNALRAALGRPLDPHVALARDIDATLDRLYGTQTTPQQTTPDDTPTPHDDSGLPDDIERLRGLASEAPIVRMVSNIIQQAVESGASDIHIEPFERDLVIRYRIDGLLAEALRPPRTAAAAIVSRVKILAGLDIAERRLAQDGRIRHRADGQDVDLRVSTVPALHGESVVIRILDQGGPPPALNALGLGADDQSSLNRHLDRRHGLILVTGPTGSGKTTTLYAALNRLNETTRKVITVEDPIEFQIDRVIQTQVKPDIGHDFAHILRAVLRQDPDTLMIGEIRDVETARIAAQSALTGHLVLSTLHTNDAPSAVTRLLDMGLEDYLITATVNLVIAQRLVRVLCTACREPAPVPPEAGAILSAHGITDPTFFTATGCDACGGRGFRGRTGLYELFDIDEASKVSILAGDRHLRNRTGRSVFTDGVLKAAAGITTMDEVRRVAQDHEPV